MSIISPCLNAFTGPALLKSTEQRVKEYSHFFTGYAEHSYVVVQAPAISHRIACRCWPSLVFGSRLLQESEQPHILLRVGHHSPSQHQALTVNNRLLLHTLSRKKIEGEAWNHFKIFYSGFETYGSYIEENLSRKIDTPFFFEGGKREKKLGHLQ